jgi:arylsulfatase A-like enzyme
VPHRKRDLVTKRLRRSALLLTGGGLAILACVLACTPAPRPTPVVIFVVDTLRADRLGSYGDETARTPQIDALATESALFENAHAAAPWTLPSVVSLLTSTFPCEHNVLADGDRLSETIPTLAEGLEKAGYATASAYGNPYAGPMSGLDRGFFLAEFRVGSRALTVQRTLDGLGGSPFFLYLHNEEPHDPYSEKLFIPEYQVSDTARTTVNNQLQRLRELGRIDFVAGRPRGVTDNSVRQTRRIQALRERSEEIHKLYAKDVAIADHRVGSVDAELKRRGVWDQTLFILVSDHGEEFDEHGAWQHDQSAYEELMRVPLMIHFPDGNFAGERVEAAVSLVDVVPTVADVLGLPNLAEHARGVSLLPLLRGETPDDDPPRVTGMRINRKKYYRPHRELRGDVNVVVRQQTWKAIYNADLDSVELYDLSTDPSEQQDRAASETARANLMSERARTWYRACVQTAAAAGESAEIAPEEAEQLRALGYTE